MDLGQLINFSIKPYLSFILNSISFITAISLMTFNVRKTVIIYEIV